MRRLVQAATTLGCLLLAGGALAQPAPPAAPQFSLDPPATDAASTLVNRPLLVTGLLVFGGAYAGSVIEAAARDGAAGGSDLYYPVVGPWMAAAIRCDASHPCSRDDTGGRLLLVVDGVGQALGAVAMAASLFVPEKTSRRWFFVGEDGFQAGPSRVGTGYGIGAAGVF